ncbi:hypothetical protein A9Y76_08055 [Ralstonia insidiosa]|uniref:Uncharacterized protein n=1 Tax=Ralstonia insidiosa TaxID=190721 RepID=A0A191ZWH3_9RALS|nr:hypothetical protein A9Y76_08055 [Ralstonia insidiosa]
MDLAGAEDVLLCSPSTLISLEPLTEQTWTHKSSAPLVADSAKEMNGASAASRTAKHTIQVAT